MIEIFDILFSVSFRHTYYWDKTCKDISVIPDPDTMQLIKKYGFIYRETKEGFTILSECIKSNNDSILSHKTNMDLQFNFLIQFNNPYLLNITDVTETAGQSVHYFSNKLIESSNENEKLIIFEPNNFVEFATQSFEIKDALIKHRVFERSGKTIPITAENDSIPLIYNITGLDSGIYQFHSDNIDKTFYKSPLQLSVKPFAIVNIELKNQSIADNGVMKKPVYILQLETKKTYWQYLINVKQNSENLIIESQGNTEIFNKSDSSTLEDIPVIIFTSKEQIPITERREDYFRLKLRNGNPDNDQIIISKLPIPDISVLNRNVDGKMYSPIFVNY